MLLDGRHEGQAPEIDGKVILCDVVDEPERGWAGEFVRARVMRTTDHDLIASMDLERDVDEFDDELLEPAAD